MHYTLKYKAILTLTNHFEDFSPRSVGPIVLGVMAEQQTCHGPKLPKMWLEYKIGERDWGATFAFKSMSPVTSALPHPLKILMAYHSITGWEPVL